MNPKGSGSDCEEPAFMQKKNALKKEKLIKKKARQRELQEAEEKRRKQAAERRLELQALRDRARMEGTR